VQPPTQHITPYGIQPSQNYKYTTIKQHPHQDKNKHHTLNLIQKQSTKQLRAQTTYTYNPNQYPPTHCGSHASNTCIQHHKNIQPTR